MSNNTIHFIRFRPKIFKAPGYGIKKYLVTQNSIKITTENGNKIII
jgi:hypothetical protein